MRGRLAGVALALLLVGSITFTYQSAAPTLDVRAVEVPFGTRAAGASVGANATQGSVSVAGGVLATTTNLLYLNNTNASAAWFAKLTLSSSTGVSNVVALTIGIDNGTSTPQITATLGSLSQTAGPYVRLPPASTNRVYVTQSVTAPGAASSFTFTVTAADDAAESAYVNTTATLSIT